MSVVSHTTFARPLFELGLGMLWYRPPGCGPCKAQSWVGRLGVRICGLRSCCNPVIGRGTGGRKHLRCGVFPGSVRSGPRVVFLHGWCKSLATSVTGRRTDTARCHICGSHTNASVCTIGKPCRQSRLGLNRKETDPTMSFLWTIVICGVVLLSPGELFLLQLHSAICGFKVKWIICFHIGSICPTL